MKTVPLAVFLASLPVYNFMTQLYSCLVFAPRTIKQYKEPGVLIGERGKAEGG